MRLMSPAVNTELHSCALCPKQKNVMQVGARPGHGTRSRVNKIRKTNPAVIGEVPGGLSFRRGIMHVLFDAVAEISKQSPARCRKPYIYLRWKCKQCMQDTQ